MGARPNAAYGCKVDGIDTPPPIESGCYPCRGCGRDVPAEALRPLSRLAPTGERFHAADDPDMACGPVACDECDGTEFEPYAEDPRLVQCSACAHVCAHQIGVGL